MDNALRLWIDPEIRRRREAGKLAEDFVLSSAQVILSLDAEKPDVRLNQEVRVVAKMKVNRAIQAGEYVMESDVDTIESLELTSQDANAAHLTIVFFRDSWHIAFDFRYNAARTAQAVAAAREFLDVAADALKRAQMRAFVDNLFSATELLAKSTLLLLADRDVLEGKRHTLISSRYNRWGRTGNVERRYLDLLNRLGELRGPARYAPSNFALDAKQAADSLGVAEEMYMSVRRMIPPRAEVGPQSKTGTTP